MELEVDQEALKWVQASFWDNFWAQGGFGMYPTAFWGFLLLFYAGLYVLRPQERFLRAVAILASMTLVTGALGTTMGFMIALRYAARVAPELAARSACYGASMALHVVILAFVLVIFGGIVTAVGSRRQALLRAAAQP